MLSIYRHQQERINSFDIAAPGDRENGHPPLSSYPVFPARMYTSVVPKLHRGTQGVTMNSQGCYGISCIFEGNTTIFNSCQTPCKLLVRSSSRFQYEMTLHDFWHQSSFSKWIFGNCCYRKTSPAHKSRWNEKWGGWPVWSKLCSAQQGTNIPLGSNWNHWRF